MESFELDPSVFKAFRTFCFAEGFSLNTNTEKHLKKALDYSEEEDLNNLSASLESVRKSLETEKKLVFNQSEERIMWQLSEEIIKCNFYKEGVYQYSLLKNNAIQKAKSVLKDSQGYYSLLK